MSAYVAHVNIPVLVLSGRYDATFPLQSSQRPLFHFLGTARADKKQVIYEGGHGVFPRPEAVRECLDWLDRYLGPVRRFAVLLMSMMALAAAAQATDYFLPQVANGNYGGGSFRTTFVFSTTTTYRSRRRSPLPTTRAVH